MTPGGTRLSYAELAALGTDGVTIPNAETVSLKDKSAFQIIGKDMPRRDVFDKSTGRAIFAIDVEVPDMAHATVLRAPVEGETLVRIDDAEAARCPASLTS